MNLSPASIFVIPGTNLSPNSYELRFVGFEYAKKLEVGSSKAEVDLEFEQNNNLYLAPEVIVEGVASVESDVYSAGKLF